MHYILLENQFIIIQKLIKQKMLICINSVYSFLLNVLNYL